MIKYFLDTNIIMYAVGKEHHYKKPCAEIINLIAKEEVQAVINTETLQEILHRYWYIGKKEKTLEIVHNLLILIPEVLVVTKEDIKVTTTIIKKYPKLECRDALHIAVMLNNKITNIISTDKQLDKVREINKIDPVEFLGYK